jgi:hypothetical protein
MQAICQASYVCVSRAHGSWVSPSSNNASCALIKLIRCIAVFLDFFDE